MHYPSLRLLWGFYAFAALGFLPTLGFYSIGEEAIHPIVSLEMWHQGEWMRQLLYGNDLQHYPLFNWLIIPFANLAGWEHMLVVARAITVAATLTSGLLVAWLARRLTGDARFAAFAALAYLTLEDVLMYRGWLAYVDPLFALLVFASIAALWVACLENSRAWLAAGALALVGAVFAKAYTAYVFYGSAGLVLLFRHRRFLLSPFSWLVHAAALAAPFAWLALRPGGHAQSGRMFGEILAKLMPTNLLDYAIKLVAFPADTLLRMAPLAPLVIYFLLRRRVAQPEGRAEHFRTALFIAVLGYLPYWLAPQSSIRYLLPILPLFALVMARLVWRTNAAGVALTLRWLAAAIILKLILVLFAFPYYQSHYRGQNYAEAAADIQRRTAGHTLYSNDSSASGLNVTAHLDILRLPAAPLVTAPAQWDSGFVLAYTPDPALGRTYRVYQLAGDKLYLLCRGAACDAPER